MRQLNSISHEAVRALRFGACRALRLGLACLVLFGCGGGEPSETSSSSSETDGTLTDTTTETDTTGTEFETVTITTSTFLGTDNTDGTEPVTTSDCATDCPQGRCQNECGGSCDCETTQSCGADGWCYDATDCEQGCEGVDAECGFVCGSWCGPCAQDETCSAFTCAAAVSCPTCPLFLALVEKQVQQARLKKIVVSLNLLVEAPSEGPRLFDLHLRSSDKVRLVSVQEGAALKAAGKTLFVDPSTGKPFSVAADGTVRLLAVGTSGSTMASGQLAVLTFVVDSLLSVDVSLVRTEPVFTPPQFDEQLQMTRYDHPIAVNL
ncbi:MAG: hypothetical protein MUC50_17310 [Myxococcota bacterium]|jgi:hypothetical protein|nr:hypothetical protein [Myxococcota bacterium]